MICMLCGYETKNSLGPHLKNFHKMSGKDYINQTGGEIYSKEFRTKISSRVSVDMQKRWKNEEWKGKHLKKLHSKKTGLKISKTLSKKYKTGEISAWNSNLTKENDARLRTIGDKNRKKLTGRKKENYEYLRLANIKRAEAWNKKSIYEKQQIAIKKSKTFCKLLSNGEVCSPIKYRYKNGYYNGEYYRSSLELESMKFFDSCKYVKKWTTKHGIVIRYYSTYANVFKNYVPDFMIELIDGRSIIIETKGEGFLNFNDNGQIILDKHLALAKQFKNSFLCFSVEEVEDIIYGLFKN